MKAFISSVLALGWLTVGITVANAQFTMPIWTSPVQKPGKSGPPIFSIDAPEIGPELVSDHVTIRGPSNDPGATFVAEIIAGGRTNTLSTSAEPSGYFRFEHVPLAAGPNRVTLVAKDAAGNTSRTNFVFYGSKDIRIHMDPVSAPISDSQNKIDLVSGWVQPTKNQMWEISVNGIKATMHRDGTWLAKNVPTRFTARGNTTLFNVDYLVTPDLSKGNTQQTNLLSTQANLGAGIKLLNASTPACGGFHLHLNETAGRTFVLEASTNLVEWVPILTNSSPDHSFDYVDTNASNFRCRFFRVVPLN
jgi:hypothetical protein